MRNSDDRMTAFGNRGRYMLAAPTRGIQDVLPASAKDEGRIRNGADPNRSFLVHVKSRAPILTTNRRWLVAIGGFIYAISMHKFAMRDPLSANTGIQGIIEIFGMAGAFVCIFAATWETKRQHGISRVGICFAVFGMFALASSWRSWDAPLSFVKGSLLLLVLATGYLSSQAGLAQRYLRSIFYGYTALLVIGLLIGYFFPHLYSLISTDPYSGRTRLSVFDTFPGTLGEDAALLILIAPLIRVRFGWILQCFLFLMNIFAGGKTSTGLLCLLLLIRFLYGSRARRSWRIALFIVGLGALWLLVLAGHGDLFSHAADSIYGTRVGTEASDLDGRINLWMASLNLLKSTVFMGYGIDGTRDKIMEVAGWAGTSHNSYLQLALSAGAVGSAFFLFGLFSVLRSCLRAAPPFRLHIALIIVFLMVNAVIGEILTAPSYFGILIMLWLSYKAKAMLDVTAYREVCNSSEGRSSLIGRATNAGRKSQS